MKPTDSRIRKERPVRHQVNRWILTLGVVVFLLGQTGCGWLFNKQGKPMTVVVELTPSDSLNFDGESPRTVKVKIYILKDMRRFTSYDVRVFFDDMFDPDRLAEMEKQDVMAGTSVILSPGEPQSIELVVPYAKARDAKPALGVIADFNRPPTDHKERLAFTMRKKSKQRIKIDVGENWVQQAGK